MKQNRINKAYPVLAKLSDLKLPIKKARELYGMTKKMSEHFEFALNEEKKYIETYGGTLSENGTISFASPEKFAEFQEKLIELNESEVDWKENAIFLTEEDIGEQTVSVSDLYRLEGFVHFE